MTAKTQGKELLELAKSVVEHQVKDQPLTLPKGFKERYKEKRGAFVTLTKKGELRGCIGFIEPLFPLWETIVRAAEAACSEDPRFPSVSEDELKELDMEISLLTLPQQIIVKEPKDYPSKIEIGRDGLIVEYGHNKGLLLPQVAAEWHFSPQQFLEHTCMKAGLPKDAYLNSACKVFTFQAEIFH